MSSGFLSTSRLLRPARAAALGAGLAAAVIGLSGCTTSSTTAAEPAATKPVVDVVTTSVVEQDVRNTTRATGTLVADAQAEVAAEVAGRIVGTPVERGTVVASGAVLVQLSATEAGAQVAEAEANSAQSAAALNLAPDGTFDVEQVPEVANARASLALAESEYGRIKSLLDERVVSQSEYDQRRTQVEAARQQYESARNMARQRFRAYQATLARVTLARKSLSDTTVRAPFAGVVAERRVSTGDYVSKGQVVAVVVRVDPLRVELPIPEQDVARVAVGQPVTFRVEAYPGRQFTGTVRHISPALRVDQRAMTVEAIVANPGGELKPGLFAAAEITESAARKALVVDADALREVGNTQRAFVVVDRRRLEDRIVTTRALGDGRLVVSSGLSAGDVVALPSGRALADGIEVRPTPRGATPPK